MILCESGDEADNSSIVISVVKAFAHGGSSNSSCSITNSNSSGSSNSSNSICNILGAIINIKPINNKLIMSKQFL